MSLILPIMVHSKTIGALTISRMELLEPGGGEYTYTYELCMNDTPDLLGKRRPQIAEGVVKHNYTDGAVELIKKVAARL